MRFHRTPPRLEDVDYAQDLTYLITFCVADRRAAFSESTIASIATEELRHFRDAGLYYLYGYAVMPDHIHAVMRLRKVGIHLSKVVRTLRAAITIRVRRLIDGFEWQRGYHERIIHGVRECRETVDYVLANPFRAGLVAAHEQYEYSGIVDRWR
ncbi:MAG TPA: transposase [Candidatus Eremiobacteraceae bacterium]|nr:transposase [Candidatus Eremiobacteraceae bacterium]